VLNLLIATGIGLAFLLAGGPIAASIAVPLVAPPILGLVRISSQA
jgi:hypothetical protein